MTTTADRVQFQVRSCGICGRQSETEVDFLQVLRCLSSILIPRTAPRLLIFLLSALYSLDTNSVVK
jgi:hypothetical protein